MLEHLISGHASSMWQRTYLVFIVTVTAVGCSTPASHLDTTTKVESGSMLRQQSEDFARRFRSETGTKLSPSHIVAVGENPSVVVMNPSRAAQSQFGRFTLMIFLDARTADTHAKAAGDPNAKGISWKRQQPQHDNEPFYWTAVTTYRNVVLSWDAPLPKVDERWRRLDATVRQVVG
jgi:hypothetical protein